MVTAWENILAVAVVVVAGVCNGCCRYRRMQEQRDNKAHEAAIILTRLEQSTHHQQLTLVQQLKDTIGKWLSGVNLRGDAQFND